MRTRSPQRVRKSIRRMLRKGLVKHAWFSAQAEKIAGRCLYRTPDGRRIWVTVVLRDRRASYGWKDKRYLGVVCDSGFIRRVDGERQLPEHRRIDSFYIPYGRRR